jgi:hypothetical protein
MSVKSITDYNQRDIYTLFMELYKQKHGVPYSGAGFINNEMLLIKGAIAEYGAPKIACAVLNCVKGNDQAVNVPYFIAGIKHYLTPHNPHTYWAVQRFGDEEIKSLWKQYIFLKATWLPKASQRKRVKEIRTELTKWAKTKR